MGKNKKHNKGNKGNQSSTPPKAVVPYVKPSPPVQPTQPTEGVSKPEASTGDSSIHSVQPEHVNLTAYQHVRDYMKDQEQKKLTQEDLNAILRLSQHLRVFGLLSATGYVNQSNDQEGKVRERTVPVWTSLLGNLVEGKSSIPPSQLMVTVQTMAKDRPAEYMALWRRSLILANHWNFWARAHKE